VSPWHDAALTVVGVLAFAGGGLIAIGVLKVFEYFTGRRGRDRSRPKYSKNAR